jgi:effector-binding domain-containing protein/predicted small secreted protein
MKNLLHCLAIVCAFLLAACVDNSTRDTTKEISSTTKKNVDSNTISVEEELRKSTATVEEVQLRKQLYVVMKESAFTMNDLEKKRQVIYNNLTYYLKNCNQESLGYKVAWFSNDNSLQFIEAGMPVNGKCLKKEPGVYYKEITEKRGVKAVFKGPLDKVQMAYDSLQSWATTNKKKLKPTKLFIYKIDGSTEKDATFHETEIVMYY